MTSQGGVGKALLSIGYFNIATSVSGIGSRISGQHHTWSRNECYSGGRVLESLGSECAAASASGAIHGTHFHCYFSFARGLQLIFQALNFQTLDAYRRGST